MRDEHFHNQRNQGIALKPGFDALFYAIKQHGLLTAIVTSSHLPEVKHNFAGSEYLAQFELVITAEDVERGKPNPDCYQMAYRHLGVDTKQCLVLEDSNNGIKAALAAECHAVMIPDLCQSSTGLEFVSQTKMELIVVFLWYYAFCIGFGF